MFRYVAPADHRMTTYFKPSESQPYDDEMMNNEHRNYRESYSTNGRPPPASYPRNERSQSMSYSYNDLPPPESYATNERPPVASYPPNERSQAGSATPTHNIRDTLEQARTMRYFGQTESKDSSDESQQTPRQSGSYREQNSRQAGGWERVGGHPSRSEMSTPTATPVLERNAPYQQLENYRMQFNQRQQTPAEEERQRQEEALAKMRERSNHLPPPVQHEIRIDRRRLEAQHSNSSGRSGSRDSDDQTPVPPHPITPPVAIEHDTNIRRQSFNHPGEEAAKMAVPEPAMPESMRHETASMLEGRQTETDWIPGEEDRPSIVGFRPDGGSNRRVQERMGPMPPMAMRMDASGEPVHQYRTNQQHQPPEFEMGFFKSTGENN